MKTISTYEVILKELDAHLDSLLAFNQKLILIENPNNEFVSCEVLKWARSRGHNIALFGDNEDFGTILARAVTAAENDGVCASIVVWSRPVTETQSALTGSLKNKFTIFTINSRLAFHIKSSKDWQKMVKKWTNLDKLVEAPEAFPCILKINAYPASKGPVHYEFDYPDSSTDQEQKNIGEIILKI